MDPREIVDAYLGGRINSWGVYRRLKQLGLSTATALAVAGALPGAVKSFELGTLTAVAQSAQEAGVLDALVTHLAAQLERFAAGGPVRPLAVTLARIGANNSNLINCDTCDPILININTGPVNLTGRLNALSQLVSVDTNVTAAGGGNLEFNLEGTVNQVPVNLIGTIDPPPNDPGLGLNIGRVNLNFSGNAGEMSLNLNDYLANIPRGDTRLVF